MSRNQIIALGCDCANCKQSNTRSMVNLYDKWQDAAHGNATARLKSIGYATQYAGALLEWEAMYGSPFVHPNELQKKIETLDIAKIVDKMTAHQKVKYKLLCDYNYKYGQNYAASFVGIPAKLPSYLREVKQELQGGNKPSMECKIYDKGELFNFFQEHKKTTIDPTKFKKPLLNTGDYIGVEIECLLPKDLFSNDGESSCDCDDPDYCDCDSAEDDNYIGSVRSEFKNQNIPNVQIVTDGSLDCDTGEYFGLEFKVMFRENDFKTLESVCKWLKSKRAIVNKTCGLHVHLDARKYTDKTVKNLANRFGAALPFLSKMVPESRVNNRYCQNQVSFNDRYSAVNGESYYKHKTLEIRLHTGSTDFDKIRNWVRLLSHIKKSEKLETYKPRKIKTWFAAMGIPEDLRDYVFSRIMKFNTPWLVEQGVYILTATESVHENSENNVA